MQIYRVGGSVRDELLNLAYKDSDWVVVGATPQEMLDLGYKPVGKDFPVFLHPDTHEEYALARTERKTGPGYTGFDVHFAPDITLEEDLLRRDLTINAIALDAQNELIDPHGGQDDLAAKLLRHVSIAFAEDPVRILRCARFAARFADFSVANETLQLMRQMVGAGEADALVAERVWQEVSRGLMENAPNRMLEILEQCGALAVVMPGLTLNPTITSALQWCVKNNASVSSRIAVIALALGNQVAFDGLNDKIRIPNDCRDVGRLALREREAIESASNAGAPELLALLERIDGLRRPDRVAHLLVAIRAFNNGAAKASTDRIGDAIIVAGSVDAGAIARPLAAQGSQAIQQAVAQARVAAIAHLLD